MDCISRNAIFMENEGMIQRTIRRNWPLIVALHLERDDVYQELAVAVLNAIDSFDPMRSECIRTHIWMQLQYAILSIKRRYRPSGLTGRGCQRQVVLSLNRDDGLDMFLAVEPEEDAPELSPRMRQALSHLDPAERRAVIRYLRDQDTKREAAVRAALDKVRAYYLDAVAGPYCVPVL